VEVRYVALAAVVRLGLLAAMLDHHEMRGVVGRHGLERQVGWLLELVVKISHQEVSLLLQLLELLVDKL